MPWPSPLNPTALLLHGACVGVHGGTPKQRQRRTADTVRHYRLCVRFHSLETAYGQFSGALISLEKFFVYCHGNLTQSAVENRLQSIDGYCSSEESG